MNKSSIVKLSILISIGLLPSCVTPTNTNPQVSPSTSVSVSPSSDVTSGVGNPSATSLPSSQASATPSSSPNPSVSASSQPNPIVSASANVNTTTALTIPSEFLSLSYYDYYSAELKWKQITGAKSYRIYQDGKVIADNLTSAIYYVKNLTPHTNYKFDIVAVNDAGESNKSTISMRTFIPSTPTNNNTNYTPEPVNPRNVPVGNVIFVDQSSTYGANNGTTWNNAYTNLQDALNVATSGQQVWVAKGTYYPSTPIMIRALINGREASFNIKSGVKVYGGFVGTELTLDNRNPSTNVTTLSGDINQDDNKVLKIGSFNTKGRLLNNYENSYHVVRIVGTEEISNTGSVLDGFTVTAGNASGGYERISISNSNDNSNGGGLIIKNASPIINNVIFSGNNADQEGGAIYTINEGETLNNKNAVKINGSKFINNYSNYGGAIYNNTFTANITNSTFTGNNAYYDGGAIYNNNSVVNLNSSIFTNNIGYDGYGIYSDQVSTFNYLDRGNTFTDTTINSDICRC